MTILVTGGAGYIGSQVVADLLLDGFEVVVLDNLTTGKRHLVPEGAIFVKGDVTNSLDLDLVFKKYSPQYVIHMAAYTRVDESVKEPLKYYDNNYGGTLKVLSAVQKFGVKGFVFSSTAAVYGNVSEPQVSEESPTKPISPYGKSKLFSEIAVRDASKAYGFKHVIFRYFNVAGADPELQRGQETEHATHLVKVAAEAACGKRAHVEVFGTDYMTKDGTCVRDFIHVCDLSKAHVRAIHYLEANRASETFNVGYGHGYSVQELLDCMQEVSKSPFTIVASGRREGDIQTIYANCKKISHLLPFKPEFDDLALICRTAYRYEVKKREQL